MMRNYVIALFLLAFATAGQAQNAPPAWLAGCWELQTPTRVTTEMWMAPAGGMMLGASRTVAGGKVREFEQLRITMSGDTIVYTASPSGQKTTSFKSTSSMPDLIRVENAAHDFPKAIQYRKVSADSIVARVEGPGKDGNTRGIDFPMKRVSCNQPAQDRPFGTLRDQAAVQQQWLSLRLERVLPRLMREQGVDMWIVPVREYNEDPVFHSLVSPTTFAARRRTIYVFFDRGGDRGIERIAIGGTSQGGLYAVVTDPNAAIGTAGTTRRAAEPFGPEQWSLLTPIVEQRDPRAIAVNVSHTHAFSDGLTVGEWEQLQRALGAKYAARVVRRELLALQYIEERLPEMLPVYVRMQELVHEIIATAFSNKVITPGTTRTQDVVWWLRQRVNDLGLGSWFQPTVSVQRRSVEMGDSANPVIMRGDVLHSDFGLVAYNLKTDTQHMGYVLREGETAAPAGLLAALRRSNRLQDLLLEEMVIGRTGNVVLARTLTRMRAEGIDGSVYTHPIGDHGHGAGPTIGLWDRQEGVVGRGDVALRPNTWFSIELQATSAVPEWNGQRVRMAQEEEAMIDSTGARRWVLRRQSEFHVVR